MAPSCRWPGQMVMVPSRPGTCDVMHSCRDAHPCIPHMWSDWALWQRSWMLRGHMRWRRGVCRRAHTSHPTASAAVLQHSCMCTHANCYVQHAKAAVAAASRPPSRRGVSHQAGWPYSLRLVAAKQLHSIWTLAAQTCQWLSPRLLTETAQREHSMAS